MLGQVVCTPLELHRTDGCSQLFRRCRYLLGGKAFREDQRNEMLPLVGKRPTSFWCS